MVWAKRGCQREEAYMKVSQPVSSEESGGDYEIRR